MVCKYSSNMEITIYKSSDLVREALKKIQNFGF